MSDVKNCVVTSNMLVRLVTTFLCSIALNFVYWCFVGFIFFYYYVLFIMCMCVCVCMGHVA